MIEKVINFTHIWLYGLKSIKSWKYYKDVSTFVNINVNYITQA